MRYEEIPVLARDEIERDLATHDSTKITIALLSGALYSDDREWIEKYCLEFLQKDDRNLKYAAIVSLGHLVRLHGNLDLSLVLPLLVDVEMDPQLAGDVSLLRSEIRTFMRD
jgi:hypothetical protein